MPARSCWMSFHCFRAPRFTIAPTACARTWRTCWRRCIRRSCAFRAEILSKAGILPTRSAGKKPSATSRSDRATWTTLGATGPPTVSATTSSFSFVKTWAWSHSTQSTAALRSVTTAAPTTPFRCHRWGRGCRTRSTRSSMRTATRARLGVHCERPTDIPRRSICNTWKLATKTAAHITTTAMRCFTMPSNRITRPSI